MQILVMGMHRSGTSVIAQIVQKMGAWLGEADDMLPSHEHDNPRGYWERRNVMAANDRLLRMLCPKGPAPRTWFEISKLSLGRVAALSDEALSGLRDEIRVLDAHRPWAVKDPRLCLVLPAWHRLLDAPVHILACRNPMEVAVSLMQRENQPLPFGLGLALWEKYMICALQALDGKEVLVVSHARLLADPESECRRLEAFLASRVPSLRIADGDHVAASVVPSLYRARTDVRAEDRWLTQQQKDVHGLLERLAELPGAAQIAATGYPTPDERLAEYEDIDINGALLAEMRRELAARDERIKRQQVELQMLADSFAYFEQKAGIRQRFG